MNLYALAVKSILILLMVLETSLVGKNTLSVGYVKAVKIASLERINMSHYYDDMCPQCYPDYGAKGSCCKKHEAKGKCPSCHEVTALKFSVDGANVKRIECPGCKARIIVEEFDWGLLGQEPAIMVKHTGHSIELLPRTYHISNVSELIDKINELVEAVNKIQSRFA